MVVITLKLMNICSKKLSLMKLVPVIKLEDGITESCVVKKSFVEIVPLDLLDVGLKKNTELIPLTNMKIFKVNKI